MNYNSRNIIYKNPFGAVKTEEEITIRFPIDDWVSYNEVFFILRNKNGQRFYPMRHIKHENGVNIFECKLKVKHEGIYWYRFEMHNRDGIWYYGRDEYCNSLCGRNLPEWQLTVYKSTLKTPVCVKGGIIYHIFVDRFYRDGEIKTKRKYRLHGSWDEEPIIKNSDGSYSADDFFGGNFKGIIKKLPYLKALGVTIIYLSPIFESYSNHRYDTGDYLKLDDLLGTEEDFKDFLQASHAQNIQVILDGVFNHSGADSRYFNKFGRYDSVGAYQSKESPYYDWYYFDRFPDGYKSWWGCTNVPTLNKDNKDYQKLILGEKGVVEKWTEMGVDGWRLDVVDELPIDFTNKLCKKIKVVNKNALIIGEVWEDASTKISYSEMRPYLLGDQLDGVMNYPFKNAIIKFMFTNGIKRFVNDIMTICENYPKECLDVCMNIIGTHDTERIINVLSGIDTDGMTKQEKLDYRLNDVSYNKAKQRLKIASAIQYTLPGIPSIYYGDEVGLQGFEDPINRRPFPWDNIDYDLLAHYKNLGKIRKENKELFFSNFEFIKISKKLLSYKWYDNINELLIIINNTNQNIGYYLKKVYENLFDNKTMNGYQNIKPYSFKIIKQKDKKYLN